MAMRVRFGSFLFQLSVYLYLMKTFSTHNENIFVILMLILIRNLNEKYQKINLNSFGDCGVAEFS